MKLFLAVVAPLLLALSPQDKITLKSQPQKGDTIATSQKMAMKMTLKIKMGEEVNSMEVDHKSSKKQTAEILEVDGGKVTKAKFTIEEDFDEDKPPGAQEFMKSEKPLHGRTVTVQSQDGTLSYEGADGLADKEKKSLDLNDTFMKVFPAHPIAVGDSWDVPSDVFRALFEEDTLNGTMTLKLAEIKDYEGRSCAFLDIQAEIKGAEVEGSPTAKLKGTVVVWIERGYTMKAQLDGTMLVNVKKDNTETSGEGKMSIEVISSVK